MTGNMTRPHVVDRGYAWVILASCNVLKMLIGGFWTSFGIIFVQWESHFGVSPAETSIIGSVFMLTLLSMAPVSSALTRRFTSRVIVMVAGILTVVCLFAASFVTQFWHLYAITVVLSVAMGFSYQCSFTYFIYYFDKRLALAYMLNGASASLGYLIVPILMELLISHYGWQGAFFIFSALMANICVCGLMLHAPQLQKPKSNDALYSKCADDISKIADDTSTFVSDTSKWADDTSKCADDTSKCADDTSKGPGSKGHRKRGNVCVMFLKDVTSAFDLTLFRNVQFIFQAIINGTLFGGCFGAPMYLVPYADSVGIPASKSAFLMVIYGLSMVVIRLSPIGVLVDKKIVSASKLSGLIYLLYGVLIMATPLIRNYKQLVIVAALFGILPGLGNPLQYVVVSRSAGSREKGPAVMSWFALGNGVGASIVILFVGILHTSTGNYTCSMILCGGCVFAMGVILLMDPMFHRWENRLKRKPIANVEKLAIPL